MEFIDYHHYREATVVIMYTAIAVIFANPNLLQRTIEHVIFYLRYYSINAVEDSSKKTLFL